MSPQEAFALMEKAERKQHRCRRQQALDILDGVPKKPRQPMQHKEFSLQVQCVTWFKYQYPNILIGSSLNGVPLTQQQARREKEAGMLTGMPDLQIFAARKGYHGLFIEMKNGKKGVLREVQKEVLEKLKAQGYCVAVCRTFEQFKAIVNEYFGNTKKDIHTDEC